MGHCFGKIWVYMNTIDWSIPEREHFIPKKIDMDKFDEWAKEHPIPINYFFSSEKEALDDLQNSTGIISFNETASQDFINWFGELIDFLV